MVMDFLKEILLNPYYSSLIVLVTQICMLYLRTINIVYTTEHNIYGAIWSNNLFAIAWLLSTSIGLNAILSGNLLPIIAFLVGGSLGTYFGMKKEMKKRENQKS
jgi:uncharacterized protein YebE (UPF0316 family)